MVQRSGQMISLEHVTVQYGMIPALTDLCLNIASGECVLITGPSGCGKSTLGQVIGGLIPHAIPCRLEGNVVVAGLETPTHTIPEIAQHVGMVFQRPSAQLFHLRVEDEVAFGPRNLGLPEGQVAERTAWALQATGLEHLRDRQPTELSGGQKQCLAISAALAMRPQILVLDEPTASLDVPNTHRVLETLTSLKSEYGLTIVLIEHRLDEVARLAGRVILMEAGRIIADGMPAEIFADRELRQRLGLRRPTEMPTINWEELVVQANPAGEIPFLSLEAISAGFNGKPVIHDIHLQIYAGDFVALVGDNGTGKSTLALTIAGILKPQSGKVQFFDGRRPQPGLDVALLFQDPQEQLFTDSVNEEIAFGPENYARFEPNYHRQILAEADLWELRHRRVMALSVGQQQRTALAACLGLRPRLLILDEPTLGQDWGHLQRLMNYLLTLNQQGMTILLISHDYKLVHHYARRIILMKEGRVERIGIVNHSERKEIT